MEPKSPFPDAGTNKPDYYSGVMYCDIEELMKISNDLYVFNICCCGTGGTLHILITSHHLVLYLILQSDVMNQKYIFVSTYTGLCCPF